MAGFLSRLFGGGGDSAPAKGASESYKGFQIIAAPRKDGAQWLTAGTITKEIGGESRAHDFVRADRHSDYQGAEAFALQKGRQIIDEQGDGLFGS